MDPQRRMSLQARATTLGVALAGGLVTSAIPFIRLVYRNPSVSVALETVAALIASLAAYLFFGRFQQNRLARDLALTVGLGVLACSNLMFSAVPAALGQFPTGFRLWGPSAMTVAGSILFVYAGWARADALPHPRRSAREAVILTVIGIVGLAVALYGIADDLPQITGAGSARAAGFTGPSSFVILQLVATALFAVAAVGFMRRSERTGDELMLWLAAGSTLAAFSRLNYSLFPSTDPDVVYMSDLIRLTFYLVLMLGAGREIRAYWRGFAEKAVLEERRRIARELHDGLAQELAFISTQTRRLATRGITGLADINSAAERALSESRRAISALSRTTDEPLYVAVAQAAEEVAGRVGANIDMELGTGITVAPRVQEELLRIVREAVTNAARHGRADAIQLRLTNTDGIRLRVVDNGRGFDPGEASRGGHGLSSMRERTEVLGGTFHLDSEPGRGTAIEVVLP